MITLDKTIAREFRDECDEPLETIEAELLVLEIGGAELDARRVERVIQAVRAIQGGAIVLDLVVIRNLTDLMDDILALMCARRVPLSRDVVTVLLRAKDRLHELVQDAESSRRADVSQSMADLGALLARYTTEPEKSSSSAIPQANPGAGRLRTLIVEDDVTNQLLLQRYLSRFGECHTAVNGRDALIAFRSALEQHEGYDLVCMDIMMPEMDGHEAVREIRAFEETRGVVYGKGAKIIMTTTVGEIREVILCFKELCDAYLMKPIDLGKLLSYLKSCQMVD